MLYPVVYKEGDFRRPAMPTIRDETHKKELIHRLRRVEGQIRGVLAMIESGVRSLFR